MSLEIPNHYHLAIIRFRAHLLENLLSSTQQGLLAVIELIDFIDYYQTELHQLGEFNTHNLALASILTLRNSLANALNSINRQ
jgi:hypothetical protein